MTQANRKTIKITLPADFVQSFDDAKARAEQAAMIKLSDTQYASRLIQWALERQSAEYAAVIFQKKEGGNLSWWCEGVHPSETRDAAIRACYLLECDLTGEPPTE